MKKPFALVPMLALWLASCMPQDIDVPQSPLLRVLERKAGLIAYVGSDGNMYVSDQGGGNLMQLTQDARFEDGGAGGFRFYQFPTWSLDGSRLAFASLSGESADATQVTSQLHIAEVESAQVTDVYESQTEHPFYLYWSPNNVDLSFLSSAANPQTLILQSVSADSGERTILDAGSPYYWTWAPDGRVMITHVGSAAAAPEHVAFLQVNPDLTEDSLDWERASFQSPAWSPTGEHILLAEAGEDGENHIVLADSEGGGREIVGSFKSNTAFAWAADGQQFAYVAGDQQLSAGTLGSLHVRALTSEEEFVLDEKVIAFFWSPDSEEIAYFIPFLSGGSAESTDQSGEPVLLLELNVLDVASGESRQLFTYRPSEQFLAILPYFDQYHQSATIWSPDNNNLVLSFADDQGNTGIAIVAASGQLEPRLLAPGVLAFWSWR